VRNGSGRQGSFLFAPDRPAGHGQSSAPSAARLLAAIPRSQIEELRLEWASHHGSPYLSIRLWTKDAQGRWWPNHRRGVSVCIRELEEVQATINEAIGPADEHGRPNRSSRKPHGRHHGHRADQAQHKQPAVETRHRDVPVLSSEGGDQTSHLRSIANRPSQPPRDARRWEAAATSALPSAATPGTVAPFDEFEQNAT
jgi:hypothetical protein